MTLCIAWIRQNEEDNHEELIFATDSCLTAGETWNHGFKLFELPRQDCVICFAGETVRAYPLILNLISAMKSQETLKNPKTDIYEVLDYITILFSDLVKKITDIPSGYTPHQSRGLATFLFGGWSWKENSFKIWKIEYSQDSGGFVHNSIDLTGNQPYGFIMSSRAENVESRLQQELVGTETFDMEPLKALVKIARDSTIRDIGGALQICKIYKSGSSEFFGIMWPSISNGHYTLLGKEVPYYHNAHTRYYDPDTANILDEEILPEYFDTSINNDCNSIEIGILQKFYPHNILANDINMTNYDKQVLLNIFKKIAYNKFLQHNNDTNSND